MRALARERRVTPCLLSVLKLGFEGGLSPATDLEAQMHPLSTGRKNDFFDLSLAVEEARHSPVGKLNIVRIARVLAPSLVVFHE